MIRDLVLPPMDYLRPRQVVAPLPPDHPLLPEAFVSGPPGIG